MAMKEIYRQIESLDRKEIKDPSFIGILRLLVRYDIRLLRLLGLSLFTRNFERKFKRSNEEPLSNNMKNTKKEEGMLRREYLQKYNINKSSYHQKKSIAMIFVDHILHIKSKMTENTSRSKQHKRIIHHNLYQLHNTLLSSFFSRFDSCCEFDHSFESFVTFQ